MPLSLNILVEWPPFLRLAKRSCVGNAGLSKWKARRMNLIAKRPLDDSNDRLGSTDFFNQSLILLAFSRLMS